ncbi:hypothetical protein MASR2M17_18520 [Aminivibrio sp.]
MNRWSATSPRGAAPRPRQSLSASAAHRCDDIATAIRIADEFDVSLTVEHCTEGHLIAPFLAENKVKAHGGTDPYGKPKIELRNKSWETPRCCGRREFISASSPTTP